MKRRNFLAGLLAIPAIVSTKEEVNTVKRESIKYLRCDGESVPMKDIRFWAGSDTPDNSPLIARVDGRMALEKPALWWDKEQNCYAARTNNGVVYLGDSLRNISRESAEMLANSMGKIRETIV